MCIRDRSISSGLPQRTTPVFPGRRKAVTKDSPLSFFNRTDQAQRRSERHCPVSYTHLSSSKSLMIILPFMEEAICYCNNAKLTIESFSYLGQLNNYITLLIQPVRKFFRAGCSCFYSLFSCLLYTSPVQPEADLLFFPNQNPLFHFLPVQRQDKQNPLKTWLMSYKLILHPYPLPLFMVII